MSRRPRPRGEVEQGQWRGGAGARRPRAAPSAPARTGMRVAWRCSSTCLLKPLVFVLLFVCAGVKRDIDLCAAPGSWSQVLSRNLYLPAKLSSDGKHGGLPLIVTVDLQLMAPIEGVIQVQGDITNARTAEVLLDFMI